MLHLLLIALHATSGIVALAAGVFVLRSPGRASPAMFGIYLGALWGMVLSLAVAVAAGWPSLNASSRTLFGALTLFAVAIGARGWASYRLARQRVPEWEHRSLAHVGFTLIALFDGFVIVSALDLGAPVWLIVLAGAGGVLGGRFVIGRAGERLRPSTGTDMAARGSFMHIMKGMTGR